MSRYERSLERHQEKGMPAYVTDVFIIFVLLGGCSYLISSSRTKEVNADQTLAYNASLPVPPTSDNPIVDVHQFLLESYPDLAALDWDCATINEDSNFYRTIEAAGDRHRIESPPYVYVPGPNNPNNQGIPEIIYDMKEKGSVDQEGKYNGDYVYQGDMVCVDP